MNQVDSGFLVGGTDIPRSTSHSIASAFTSPPYFWRASVGCLFEDASCRCRGSQRTRTRLCDRATPDGAIAAAVFAVVLVGLTWIGVAVGQRVAGVVQGHDVLGDLLGTVARCGCSEEKCWPEVDPAANGRRRECVCVLEAMV